METLKQSRAVIRSRPGTVPQRCVLTGGFKEEERRNEKA